METQTTTAQTPTDRAATVGHETKQAAAGVTATATEEAKQVTREAKDQVRQLWGQTRRDLTDQASTQQARVAGSLRELADQLGAMAGAADQDGLARGLVDDVARRAGDAAAWLDQRDPGSLLEEARGFARQRPGTFLAVAAGVGVLAGRLSRSLVDEARDSEDSSDATASSPGGRLSGAGGSVGHGSTAGGYGTAGLGTTGSNGGTGMPPETSPTAYRTTQPLAPDGTPSPIDAEGSLTAEGDDALRGNR